MPDGIHVTGLAAHQVTGSLLIIKGEVLFQQLAVHFAAHIIKEPLRGRLKGHLIGKAQDAGEERHSQQTGYKPGQQVVIARYYHIIYNNTGYVGVDNG